MPLVDARGIELFVEEQGSGTPIVFSHGLLWSGRMFAPQVAALRDRYRCIVYDHRGQGRSQVPRDSTISIEDCYLDAVTLIEQLDATPCHFVGLSMGGFVGMRLAARRPDLVRSLTLMATAPDPEPVGNLGKYRLLNAVARMGGMRLATPAVAPIMLGKTTLVDESNTALRSELITQLQQLDRQIYRAVNGVLTRQGVEHELAQIQAPTLVMRGMQDNAIGYDRAQLLCHGIDDARFVAIPHAGHTLTLELPQATSAALAEFLDAN